MATFPTTLSTVPTLWAVPEMVVVSLSPLGRVRAVPEVPVILEVWVVVVTTKPGSVWSAPSYVHSWLLAVMVRALLTITLKEQLEELPTASLAVQVTVVSPMLKVWPAKVVFAAASASTVAPLSE